MIASKQDEENETKLFVWGSNSSGQLGLIENESLSFPTQNLISLVILQVSCGEEHTMLLTNQGHVYTFGSNNYGALGIGSSDYELIEPRPQIVIQSMRATEVRCGWNHSAAILECGSVYTWGRGDVGQLGNGDLRDCLEPTVIKLSQQQWVGAITVDCGARHTIVVTSKYNNNNKQKLMGIVWQWELMRLGSWELVIGIRFISLNEYKLEIKQLKWHVESHILYSSHVQPNHIYMNNKESRKVLTSGSNNLMQLGLGMQFKNTATPALLPDLSDIVAIAAGNHSAALNSRGQLYLWGQGAFGSLDKAVQFSVGRFFTKLTVGGTSGAALDEEGCVYVWGSNANGELGVGDENNRIEPSALLALQGEPIVDIAMGLGFSVAIRKQKKSDPIECKNIQNNSNMMQMQMANSEKDYLIKTLKIEQDERQALERINRDLRNKILDLTEGQDGITGFKNRLKDKEDQIALINSSHEELLNIHQHNQEEYRDYRSQILMRQQRMQEQQEAICLLESQVHELQDALRRRTSELEEAQVYAHQMSEDFRSFEEQEQEQLRTFKHQLGDLTVQLQGEQELREKLQNTLTRERSNSSALQGWADQLNHKADEQIQHNTLLQKQLTNTVQQHQRLTEALEISNSRVTSLQTQNGKLMQELAILRTSLYSEIPRDPSLLQPLEVQAVVQLNKQLNDINTQLQNKLKEKDQEILKVRQGYNQMAEREAQMSAHQRVDTTQQRYSVISNNQSNRPSNHVNETNKYSRNGDRNSQLMNESFAKQPQMSAVVENEENYDSSKGKTISELLESAHKHAKFMKRILKDIDQEELKESEQQVSDNSTPKKRLFEGQGQKVADMNQLSEKKLSSAKRYERMIKELPENIENQYARSLSEVKAKLAKLQNNRQQLDNKANNPTSYRN